MTEPYEPASWQDRVIYDGSPGSDYAYRPRQLVVRGAGAVTAAVDIAGVDPESVETDEDDIAVITFTGDVDIPVLVEELRERGFQAQPNHVYFAHCDCCCMPHPSLLFGNPLYANPLYANPLYANPLYANPLYANPLYANPLYANPLYANPLYANVAGASPLAANPLYANDYRLTGRRGNSAVPAKPPSIAPCNLPDGDPAIFVLDSGLAINTRGVPQDQQLPSILHRLDAATPSLDREEPDEDSDSHLDPVAGHGTFIAGLIEQLIPRRKLAVARVYQSNLGDVDDQEIGKEVDRITGQGLGGHQCDHRSLVNLSFGGYLPAGAFALPLKIRKLQRAGAVVVASAGNDATCRAPFPASLPGVVSVGAVGPAGPAPFTNYGPWVRACAPGVGLVSSFFREFDGPQQPGPGGQDPDRFQGWARWSGTSFAAPVVVAALAREIAMTGCTAREAVARVIDAPHLLRIPGLGTVVNVA